MQNFVAESFQNAIWIFFAHYGIIHYSDKRHIKVGDGVGLLRNFSDNMNWSGLIGMFWQVIAILICLTVHELCHGLAAYALGDTTAKDQHRLSLNPLRHLDPFGTIMMLIAGFGWAKPVMVDMRNFKHPKRDMALTALAGPISNFILSFLSLLMLRVILDFFPTSTPETPFVWSVVQFCISLSMLSLGLGIFNLIPFPPLDGSKVLGAVLPDKAYEMVMRYETIGMVILMALLFFGIFDVYLGAARSWVFNLFWGITIG